MFGNSTISTRIASLLLIAAAGILSFICVLVGWLVPPAFCSFYGLNSFEEARSSMPGITRLASDYSWFFAVVIGAVCIGALVAIRQHSSRIVQCITVGLCAQGIVVWLAMFSFFYDGFTGSMCLHHGPKFELLQFVSVGAGVFPVTLALVLTPLLVAVWPRKVRDSGNVG